MVDDTLVDSDAIPLSEAINHGVIINVPTLFIDADEVQSMDKVTPNLRVINYEKLTQLIHIVTDIGTVETETVIEKIHSMVDHLIKTINDDNSKLYLEFLKMGSSLSKNMTIDETYVDITTEGLSFDIVREYINCPKTGILQSAEPKIYNGIQFYSQLTNPSDEILLRQQTNDTDFNRIQLYLVYFEKNLTLTPGYVFNQVSRVICLGLFYLCLYFESHPIAEHCSNDLKCNILAFILDCSIRSRVIQAWQRDSPSNALTRDIAKNYDSKVIQANLINLPTSRDRALCFINLMRQKPDLNKFAAYLNFDKYMSSLEKTKLLIDGKYYYLLGAEFMTDLALNIPDIESLQKLLAEDAYFKV